MEREISYDVNGTRYYSKDGILHCEEHAAIEYQSGKKSYYLEGIEFSKSKYLKQVRQLNKKNNSVVPEFIQKIRLCKIPFWISVIFLNFKNIITFKNK